MILSGAVVHQIENLKVLFGALSDPALVLCASKVLFKK